MDKNNKEFILYLAEALFMGTVVVLGGVLLATVIVCTILSLVRS